MFMWIVPRSAASVVFISGVCAGVAVAIRTSVTWGVAAGGATWGVRVDALSSVLLVFVGFLTWLVAGYARTNLHGQERLAKFCLTFTVVVLALGLMVAGSNLVLVAAGFSVSGWGIASLIAHPRTVSALRASRLVRRRLLLGDAALWVGVGIAAVALPTIDREGLHPGSTSVTLAVVACLVLAGTVRSSLFPFHRWLPETAEAPSPVSALLHAGLVNGAGIIALLCWPLYRAAPVALGAMVLIGLCSVVLGTLNGRVRTDVKGQLACSTTAQMGYMTLQIGLGLPAAGLLHLLGHGCYKAWLFLRAGGAITRGRALNRTAVTHRAASFAGGTTAACVAVLVGFPAMLMQTAGVMGLLPGALALAVAAAAGAAIGGQRATAARLAAVVVGAGVASGGYLWLLLGWEHLVGAPLSGDPIWSGWTGFLLLSGVIALGLVTARLATDVTRAPSGVLATTLSGAGLPPWSRRIGGSLTPPDVCAPVGTGDGAEAEEVQALIRTAGAVVSPAWPLRELVAANPLAGLTVLPFDEAVTIMEGVHGARMHLPLHSYLDLLDSGRITEHGLSAALDEYPTAAKTGRGISDVSGFVRRCREAADAPTTPHVSVGRRFSEVGTRPRRRVVGLDVPLSEVVDDHAAWWTQRAWARVGDVERGPWSLWREAAVRPVYDRVIGVRGASAWAAGLPQDPAAAIGELLRRVNVESRLGYVCALLASGPGWASHAQWRGRQHDTEVPLLEVVALRMTLDMLAALSVGGGAFTDVVATTPMVTEGSMPWRPERVWQRAWEIGIHERMLASIVHGASEASIPTEAPTADLVLCIDVRSERLRRSLEEATAIRTHGFAGFFGAAIRVQDSAGRGFDQCPALIRPSAVVPTGRRPLTLRQLAHRGVTGATSTPLLALLVAEAAGALSGLASLASAQLPAQWRRQSERWVWGGRVWDQVRLPRVAPAGLRDGAQVGPTLEEKAGIAAGMLRAIGLVQGFAPLLVVCGHEAAVANNAFAAAYDCGACGGNSGRINAQVVASMLNEPAVRERLVEQGITIPTGTLAIAAVHNTTTDVLELDASSPGWESHRAELELLQYQARPAGQRSVAQRMAFLPSRPGDSRSRTAQENAARRSADWSEPMPEWGLAGNLAMVVGPRRMTAGLDLAGRVFLQSYDATLDTPEHGILEQILTAPVVVGQWINAQYYFSTIAPETFGAGDKTTHNVVGDVGVITGSHGDLRTGLPWQSLSPVDLRTDPLAARHEPARLMVVVAAAPEAVAAVLRRQPDLYGLLTNRWLRILCITDAHPEPVEMHPDELRRAVPADQCRRHT
ncbi:putative inorganic carbon transporter subunit DabA [Tessaracoccus antarcticus]|uniref:Probable inorganic carbon transporter subunit DabA n=1 Tax=Tessaracoccus antarcticus TaxID=2479848 RepID=A0A3M0G5F9_9ACTN|nr:putative inorganic carbon transporter subunit DabA [Tessaracoccus antarcticus]RMB60074.1 DUF2309 family protein [Tessaracoccus antarcticus]